MQACPRHYVSRETDILSCPSAQGLVILPAYYPARTLFIGYASEASHLALLKTLIESNQNRQSPVHIVVLISRLEVEQAYEDLKAFLQGPQAQHLTLLTMPSDETLWTQDYMEVAVSMSDGEASILDLPYMNREGESIPAAIALSCQLKLEPQADFGSQGDIPASGDYGGNIEALPGNLLLIGNTMTKTTRQRLQETLTEMTMVEIKVDWLETGHVDELFTVLPDLTPQTACPFAITYASPKLALQIIRKSGIQPGQDRLLPEIDETEDVSIELQDGDFFSECLDLYTQSKSLFRRCQRLIDANLYYDALIEQERARINAALIKRNVCSKPTWMALPQLFVPSMRIWLRGSVWGTADDRARAINPNSINIIALGEQLIIPQQPYAPFEKDIQQRLRRLHVALIPLDASFSHFLNGGLHCTTLVVRSCRKKS